MVWIIVDSFTFSLVGRVCFLREKLKPLCETNLRVEFVRELSLLVIHVDTVNLLLICSRLSKLHK